MEVLGAGFADPSSALAAEAALRRVLDVGDGDLSIQEVAGDEEFVDGATVALAGRIRESRLKEVQTIVRGHGGFILTVVPERWATPSGPMRRAAD